VDFDLQNTGNLSGAEVPQVYLSFPPAVGEAPKRLVGWTKVQLQSGVLQHISITVDASDSSHPMSVWDTNLNGWATPNGHYIVYVGNSSAWSDLAVAGSFDVGS
jgi:beta-glucosidase